MNFLYCLGVGTVAINKETDTNIIQVTLPKDFPSQDGESVANTEEVESSYNTQNGDIKQSKVLMSNTVPAKWMSINSNRITAPDVREGTKVAVYQYANTNRYLWTLDGFDGTMRLETVVYAWSASPNIDENTPISPDNYYILSISTHTGKIELLTGEGNGEACGFQFTLNTKEGYFGMMDSFGQIFMINSVESALTYVNKLKTQLSITQKDFSLINEGNTLIETKESIKMHSKSITLLADEAFYLKAKTGAIVFENNLNEEIGGSYTLSAKGGMNVTTPLAEFSNRVVAKSQLSSPSILGGGTELVGHIHGNVQSGGSTTTGPIGKSRSFFNFTADLPDGFLSPIDL